MHPRAHCSTGHASQDMEATQVSIDRGLDKEDVVHVHSGVLLSHKNAWTMPFAALQMDLEIIIPSEACEDSEDKIHAISFTCGI